jgi:hypothetical protein
MIIKLKKRKIKFIGGVLLVLALSLLTIDRQQMILAKQDLGQYLMTMNLGFSQTVGLVDRGEGIFLNTLPEGFNVYHKLLLPSLVKSIPKIIKYKMTGDDFERIDIDIKHLDFQEILQDRERAIKDHILSNPTTINANIRFLGKVYRAKLRLKGDTRKHWYSTYRMSFRVRLRGKNTILGYKSFSLQKPISRHHPYDYAFQSMMRKMGNLSGVHSFAHVYVNGTDWGIMDIEEHMSKEFLEKLKRKESSIVRFSNEKLWTYKNQVKVPYLNYRISDPLLFVHLYGSGKNLKDSQYRKVYSYILKENLNNSLDLYAIDDLAKAYILATAWGSWHTLTNNNTRYYFNPYTLKLEPITTDQPGYLGLSGMENIFYRQFLPDRFISLMSTQSYMSNLSGNLNRVHDVVLDINRHLNTPGLLFPVDQKKNGGLVIDNFNKIISNKNEYLFPSLEGIARTDTKQVKLPTKTQASEFKEHLHLRHYADGRLEFYNLLPDNVIVKDILYEGQSFLDNEIIVPSYLSEPSPIVLETQYLGIQDNKISVNTEYKGFNRETKNQVTLFSEGITNPLLIDTLQDIDFIKRIKSGEYEVRKGSWVVNEPIVIDGELHIPSGVSLKFSENSYLIIKGAITAVGSKKEPILLGSLSGAWKGLYVLKAKKRSRLKNVIIKNIAALQDGLLNLTGGVTFYKSDVDLEDVRIEGVEAEDAINIVESEFTMASVRIKNTASDGLDSDYSQGTLSESVFFNIGGDALDFSGSNIEIDNVKIANVKDKAVSGGEGSKINITRSYFEGVGVGIASKDGSSVLVSNTSILDYRLHAAMSYIKKDFYSMPKITLIGCKVDKGNPYVRQKGTRMLIDNVEIPAVSVNVKKLYQSEAMRK